MTKPIESDPDGEKLNTAINEAADRKVLVSEKVARIVAIRHKLSDNSDAARLEGRLFSLGFQYFKQYPDKPDPKNYFWREWIRWPM